LKFKNLNPNPLINKKYVSILTFSKPIHTDQHWYLIFFCQENLKRLLSKPLNPFQGLAINGGSHFKLQKFPVLKHLLLCYQGTSVTTDLEIQKIPLYTD